METSANAPGVMPFITAHGFNSLKFIRKGFQNSPAKASVALWTHPVSLMTSRLTRRDDLLN
jgi:hypothetical protein